MTKQQKNSTLVFAIALGLFSLPLNWMTFHDVAFQGGMAELFNSTMGPITIGVTGLTGEVSFPFRAPIWWVVAFLVSANVVQLMKNSKEFAIPPYSDWISAIMAVVWISSILLIALFSGKATFGIGSILILASAFLPLACLALPESKFDSSESEA